MLERAAQVLPQDPAKQAQQIESAAEAPIDPQEADPMVCPESNQIRSEAVISIATREKYNKEIQKLQQELADIEKARCSWKRLCKECADTPELQNFVESVTDDEIVRSTAHLFESDQIHSEAVVATVISEKNDEIKKLRQELADTQKAKLAWRRICLKCAETAEMRNMIDDMCEDEILVLGSPGWFERLRAVAP
jgi:hypothetical protein